MSDSDAPTGQTDSASSAGIGSLPPGAPALARVRRFVETYVQKGPYALYPEHAVTENVIEGLAANLEAHGKMYCPCTPIDEAIARGHEMVCPCVPHHADIARQGHCDCALFAAKDLVRGRKSGMEEEP